MQVSVSFGIVWLLLCLASVNRCVSVCGLYHSLTHARWDFTKASTLTSSWAVKGRLFISSCKRCSAGGIFGFSRHFRNDPGAPEMDWEKKKKKVNSCYVMDASVLIFRFFLFGKRRFSCSWQLNKLQRVWIMSAVLPFVFIGVIVGVYVHILILQSVWPCSCTTSLCGVNFVLWWLLYKSRASQRAVEGCALFIVSLVDCWTLHCCLFPIRFGGETLPRNYLVVMKRTMPQSRPQWFTLRSSWGQGKIWVNGFFLKMYFLLGW